MFSLEIALFWNATQCYTCYSRLGFSALKLVRGG
jgi:hypothetical protein